MQGRDAEYMKAACMAATFSKDPVTRVGSVLVDGAGVFERGYNNIPDYLYSDIRSISRFEKQSIVIHAERDAILRAARFAKKTMGHTIYSTWLACPRCAVDIIQSGIKRAVGHRRCLTLTPKRWTGQIGHGVQILRKGGVRVDWLEEDCGVEILFNGKKVLL